MTSTVDAVIAALRVVLQETEYSQEEEVLAEVANRWISELPRPWFAAGRWNNLKIDTYDVPRDDFIRHVRATIAFLEANREQIVANTIWFARKKAERASPNASEPIDAGFEVVSPHNVHSLPVPPPNKRNR